MPYYNYQELFWSRLNFSFVDDKEGDYFL